MPRGQRERNREIKIEREWLNPQANIKTDCLMHYTAIDVKRDKKRMLNPFVNY